MQIIKELNVAVTHLEAANQQAQDYRVREAVTNAILIVGCASHIQRKIDDKTEKVQIEPPLLPSS